MPERDRAGEYIASADRPLDEVLIEPLDYKIIELLPDQGSLHLGVIPVGEMVSQISKKLGGLPSSLLSGRMRVLQIMGLAVPARATGSRGTLVWQVTPKGKEVLAEWQKKPES